MVFDARHAPARLGRLSGSAGRPTGSILAQLDGATTSPGGTVAVARWIVSGVKLLEPQSQGCGGRLCGRGRISHVLGQPQRDEPGSPMDMAPRLRSGTVVFFGMANAPMILATTWSTSSTSARRPLRGKTTRTAASNCICVSGCHLNIAWSAVVRRHGLEEARRRAQTLETAATDRARAVATIEAQMGSVWSRRCRTSLSTTSSATNAAWSFTTSHTPRPRSSGATGRARSR